MQRAMAAVLLGLMSTACDSPRDKAYYDAHHEEARIKVASCSQAELLSDAECRAAAGARERVLMEARRVMLDRVCGLLTDAEASDFVGPGATGRGTAKPEIDASDCRWGADGDLFVEISIMGPRSFTQDTPARMFDDMVNGFRRGAIEFEELPAIGDKAILVIDGGGFLIEEASPQIMSLTALKGDSWLHVLTNGLSREQTIDVARIAAKRL